MSIEGVFYNGIPLEEVFKAKEVKEQTTSIIGEKRVVRLGQDEISGITLVFNGPVTINITTK